MRTISPFLAVMGLMTLMTTSSQGQTLAPVMQLALADNLPSVSKDIPGGSVAVDELLAIVARNDLQAVKILLGKGMSAGVANDLGATPLYAAAALSDPAMTQMLLAAGADPNAALQSGETPLMAAAYQGKVQTLQALLKGGADPNKREKNGGQSALMWAIAERHPDAVEALIKGGADIQALSKSGSTALMFAAQQPDPKYTNALIAAGANPNDVMGKTKMTPLLIASAMGNTDVAITLLEKGADPNAVDFRGFTPLHHAARDKRALKLVLALLKHKADPNIRMAQARPVSFTTTYVALRGATPLVLASEINNFEILKALVAGGADPLIPTDSKTTALMLAAGAGTDVVRPRGAVERKTAIETVKFLVERGADVNGVGEYGWTPLHAAAYQGLNDVIEFLVARGGRLDVLDGYGQTPRSIAETILTRKIGASTLQIPRIFRKDTLDLLIKLGAPTPEESGVDIVLRRNTGAG